MQESPTTCHGTNVGDGELIKVSWKELFASGKLGFSIYETIEIDTSQPPPWGRRAVLKFQFGKNGNRNLKDAIIIYKLKHDHSRT
jgi:hypothetical protein